MDVWYLVHFGSVDVEHFSSEDDLLAYMRAALRSRGVDVRSNSSAERVQDEYIDMVEAEDDGPVQWGRVEPQIVVAKRRSRKRSKRSPRSFVVT